ncbi:MAG: B3/4 domain-containing protein [Candidatus Kerfeldbacteria bacterium]|jgi:DNA/RNA-binding domain of Phe-tRNA-synthetase-like protein
MVDFSISSKLKKAAPNLVLGVVTASVEVTKHDNTLWSEINGVIKKLKDSISIEQSLHLPPVEALRSAYKALGKDPSRYRSSAEALLRRIIQGKGLYQINTIVDINNLVSLETMHSVGSYSLDKLNSPIEFGVGNSDEQYKGIGKEMINITELPVFRDQVGPFGSPTSDSERAMISLDATSIMMVIISFSGQKGLNDSIQRLVGLLQVYSKATNIETVIV